MCILGGCNALIGDKREGCTALWSSHTLYHRHGWKCLGEYEDGEMRLKCKFSCTASHWADEGTWGQCWIAM